MLCIAIAGIGLVVCNLLGEAHADSVLWSQDDHRTCFDRLPRSQLKVVSSEQIAQNHEHLQHRIVTTDTASGSASEREIGEGSAQLFVRFGETFWLEAFWALPVARRMVRPIHIDDDRR